LRIMAADVTVRALSITGFRGNGIEVLSAGERTRIYGSWIGVGTDGIANGNQFDGISVSASDVLLGADGIFGQQDGNVVSGNGGVGIRISGSTATYGARLVRNKVGTDPSGSTAMGNVAGGIAVQAPLTRLDGNVVAANGAFGVVVSAPGAALVSNFIG